jgi:hypothetical protein
MSDIKDEREFQLGLAKYQNKCQMGITLVSITFVLSSIYISLGLGFLGIYVSTEGAFINLSDIRNILILGAIHIVIGFLGYYVINKKNEVEWKNEIRRNYIQNQSGKNELIEISEKMNAILVELRKS